MSAKHLQRLRAQLVDPAVNSDTDDDSEEDAPQPSKLKFNPFDLINVEADASDDAAEPSSPAAPAAPAPPLRQPSAASKKASAHSRKAKQRAGKGGSKAADDDIDQLLKEMQMAPSARPSAAPQQASGKAVAEELPLLAVNTKRLKGDDELKRIFGASVLAEEARSNEGQRMRRGHSRHSLKPGLLVTPKPHWPPLPGGLSMEVAGVAEDGAQVFSYKFSSGYAVAQMAFEEAQATHDPNAVQHLLLQQPYHVDSLLTMYELYKSTGDHASADDMLERCLYACEMAWHHAFKPTLGRCRMDFEEAQHKSFFLALFRHVQGLSRRGLHRTALEVGKLLLALDPRDPTGMLFYLDFLSVCANDWQFLRRLATEWSDGSLPLLPSYAFALPLAAFLQNRQRHSQSDPAGSQEESATEQIDAELARAVLLHPLAVARLMAKLNDQGVGRGIEWQAILREPLFAEASDGGSPTLSRVIDIFVERHHLLYKPQDVQDWMRSVCKLVAASGSAGGVSAEDCAAVRSDVFPASETNSYSHLRVDDFSDAVAALPPEEAQVQLQPLQQQPRRGGGGRAGGGGDDEQNNLVDMNVLEALFRSLAPSFREGRPPDEDDGGGRAA